MRSIAVVAQKGGQGKTTSVVNLAAAWAGQGLRVLVIDADTQANATYVLLQGRAPRRPTLSEVLLGQCGAQDAIVPSGLPGVWLIPSEPGLADCNLALGAEVGRERRLRVAMAPVGSEFDLCLVDTGPTRSLLTTNVLNFAAEVLVPLSPGVFGFLGLGQLQADVDQVRRFLENRTLGWLGVVLVLVDRTGVSRDFQRQVRHHLGDQVLRTTIPRAVKFEEANARRQPIFEHAPRSAGAVAYESLSREVLSRAPHRPPNRNAAAPGHPEPYPRAPRVGALQPPDLGAHPSLGADAPPPTPPR